MSVPARRDEPREPWEKQPGEGVKAFWAFERYLDLGPRRSLTKVGEIAGETGVANPSMIERWSSRWKWVDRADAYDREQSRKAREDHDRALSDARRTQAMAGTLAIGSGLRRLRGDPEGNVEAIDLNETDVMDVMRLMEVGAKLQLQGLGVASDIRGGASVSVKAVEDFGRSLLLLALERIEAGMLAAKDANGNLPDLIALHQEALVGEAGALYSRTMRG